MTEIHDSRKARKSTLLVGCVLALLAAWNIHRGRMILADSLAVAGVILIVMAALLPAATRGFYKIWMQFAAVLGYVNSRILLSLMYFLAMTPMGLIMRATGRDGLKRRGGKEQSYWVPRTVTRQTREGFERAF